MKDLLKRLIQSPGSAAQLLLCSLLINVLGLASSLYVIQILNRYVAHGITSTLVTLTIGVTVAVFLEVGFRQTRHRLAEPVCAQRGPRRRATGIFGVLLTARMLALEKVSQGRRAETLKDLEQAQQTLGPATLATLLDVPFSVLFLVTIALLSPIIGSVVTLFAVAAVVVVFVGQRAMRGLADRLSQTASQAGGLIADAGYAAETLRALGGRGLLMKGWQGNSDQTEHLQHQRERRQSLIQAVTGGLQGMMTVAVFAIGAPLVVQNELGVGALIGINILGGRALAAPLRLAGLVVPLSSAQQATHSAEQFLELETEPEKGTQLSGYSGQLELDAVGFVYPEAERPLFQGVSATLAPGATLAVTGSNGSGKTTLMRLMLGLAPSTSGAIRADGVDVRQLEPNHWRRQCVYLPQEPAFLNATLRDNLRLLRPDADDDTIRHWLERVGANQLVDRSAQGLDAVVTRNGADMGLGERRRLALARALGSDGRLVVLDEPTEGLDPEGVRGIYRLLIELAQAHKTLVIVTHDAQIIQGAQAVLDLDRYGARA